MMPVIHMPPVVLDQADDLFFDISLGGGGGIFPEQSSLPWSFTT